MNRTRVLAVSAAVTLTAGLIGCGMMPDIRGIPAGHVGRVLTPSGWDAKIMESGQVDLKQKDTSGRYSVLVLLEATTTTVKEGFLQKGADGEDHRVLTRNGTPLTMDFYVRCMLPDDAEARNGIFVQITPDAVKDDTRVQSISIEKVYAHFARMDVRGGARAIIARYTSYDDVVQNLEKINTEIELMVVETFKKNGVPLKVQNARISNIKPDERVYASQNELSSASAKVAAIEQIGEALRRNPQYTSYMRWEALKEMSGKGTTIIVNEGGQPIATTVQARPPAEQK